MCCCTTFPQAASQQEVASLKDHRERTDSKHQLELTALGSNLAAIRQQLESSKQKMDFSDAKIKGLNEQIKGAFSSSWLSYLGSRIDCNVLQILRTEPDLNKMNTDCSWKSMTVHELT